MHERTNSYLRYLPWVLLAGLLTYLFHLAQWLPGGLLEQSRTTGDVGIGWKVGALIFNALPGATVLVVLSRHFGRPEVGWWCGLGVLLLAVPQVVLWGRLTLLGAPVLAVLYLLRGIPYVLCGALLLRDRPAWPFLWGLLITFATSATTSGGQILNSIPWLSMKVQMSDGRFHFFSPLSEIGHLVLPVVLFVVLAELYLVVAHGPRPARFRQINLHNQYHKWQAWVLFVAFRLFLLFTALNVVGSLAMLGPINNEIRTTSPHFSTLMISLSTFSALLLLLAGLYTYRKFLLEFFLQHGKVPSYFYWFLQAPLLAGVLFPIGLLVLRPKPWPEPAHTFNRALDRRYSRMDYIRSFLIVGQVIALLAALLSYGRQPNQWLLVVDLAGVALVIWYFYNRRLLYGLFGLMVVRLLLVALTGEGFNRGALLRNTDQMLATLSGSVVLGFAVFFVMAGVLHLHDFDTGQPVEGEETDEAPDNFSDTPLAPEQL